MTLHLDGLAVDARAGELTALIGPNGVGKTTLLRTVAGLQPPLGGTVALDGTDLLALTPAQLAVVLTERAEPGLLTGRELVALGRHPHTGAFGTLGRADEAIDAVGAAHLARRRVAELSDGEHQRVLTARALAQAPDVLLLDEPSAFLDVSARVGLLGLLRTLARERGLCVVVSTHDLEPALGLADRLWLVDSERTLRTGTPEELIADGAIGRDFDAAGLAFEPVSGTFALSGASGATVRVRADGSAAALIGRALTREGATPVPDGPADAEVTPVGAGFRVQAAGTTAHVAGWPELAEWARTTRGGAPRRAGDAEVAAAVRAATSVGAYFAVETGSAAGWTELDAAGLAALTGTVAERLGTTERRVAASIMFLGVAARLVSPVLAGLGRGLVLDLDPAATAVQMRIGEALGLRCTRPGGWLGEPTVELVAEVLVEQQLRPLVAAVAADGPAEKLLWGNVASALVGALGMLERHAGGAPVAARIVDGLLDHGPLAGSGAYEGTAFRRRSCCLFYRIPGGGYCGDCVFAPTHTSG